MQNEADRESKSIGELIAGITDSLKHLVRTEIDLAKVEMRNAAGKLGGGIGLLAAAGVFAFFTFALFLTAAVAALALVLPVWASALILGFLLLIVTVVLGLTGKKKVQDASPVPTAAIENVKTDAAAVKSELKSLKEKQ